MARLAVEQGPSSRALQTRVHQEREAARKGHKRGRPPLPEPIKALTRVRRSVRSLRATEALMPGLHDRHRRALLDGLGRCRGALEELIAELEGQSL